MWCIYSCTFCKSVFIVSDDFVSPSLRGSNHISLCCRPNCLQLGSVRMPKCFLQINCIAFPINTVTTAPPPKVKGCRISIGNAHLDVNRKTSSDLMNNLKGTDSVAIATGPSACMLTCFYSTEMNRIVVNDHKAESVHVSIFTF